MTVRTDAIAWAPDGSVRLLDQTLLPGDVRYLEIHTIDSMVEAIQSLRVRGAPLIGIAAAMGMAAAAVKEGDAGLGIRWVNDATHRLAAARPTAVNLSWAVGRMRRVAVEAIAHGADLGATLRREADRIWDEDAAMCESMGRNGLDLVPDGGTILTICNTGMLATGGIGTAFGVIRAAHEAGKGIDVIACETRPLGQGARLTGWEMARLGIPGRLIVDGAAASLMASGEVDLVITGADRIAANGDTANKVGTYALAVLARAHGIPFYVAAPRSTLDPETPSGEEILIEERPAREIPAPPGIAVHNPAFDVTPADLIAALVTDLGVLTPPLGEGILALGT
ncbi:MAG TPA: S-methyl-5-thioribose-1-phosphate isomerase [Gemmatimonadales bacterium]